MEFFMRERACADGEGVELKELSAAKLSRRSGNRSSLREDPNSEFWEYPSPLELELPMTEAGTWKVLCEHE
jgi:hypothetical protein